MKHETGSVSMTDVGKRYVKYEDAPTLVEGLTKFVRRHRRGRLWAVRHVDLEVEPGEGVGVVGRNGSGKTTLLTMLAGVTAPTEGVVKVRGRLAPLLGLGVGFDQELTGRENVYINGAILGMSRTQLDRRFDDIVGFAEMEDFIDTPVKFYSSGMTVRLGFAVAISSEPSLLLVDEVLAVGDVGFQRKSFERMEQLRRDGTTVLVVSHNTAAVQTLTTRVLVLHHGSPVFLGPTDEGLRHYLDLLKVSQTSRTGDSDEARKLEILSIDIERPDGTRAPSVRTGDEMVVRVRFRATAALDRATFWLAIYREDNNVLVFSETWSEVRDYVAENAETVVLARFPTDLNGGRYRVAAGVFWTDGLETKRSIGDTILSVGGRPGVGGSIDLRPKFEAERIDPGGE